MQWFRVLYKNRNIANETNMINYRSCLQQWENFIVYSRLQKAQTSKTWNCWNIKLTVKFIQYNLRKEIWQRLTNDNHWINRLLDWDRHIKNTMKPSNYPPKLNLRKVAQHVFRFVKRKSGLLGDYSKFITTNINYQ